MKYSNSYNKESMRHMRKQLTAFTGSLLAATLLITGCGSAAVNTEASAESPAAETAFSASLPISGETENLFPSDALVPEMNEAQGEMPGMPGNPEAMPGGPGQLPDGMDEGERPELPEEMSGEMPQMPGVPGEMPGGDRQSEDSADGTASFSDRPGFPQGGMSDRPDQQRGQSGSVFPQDSMPGTQGGQNGGMNQMPGQSGSASFASSPTAIVESDVVSTSQDLSADEANATRIVMSDEGGQVKIDSAGTYLVTGSCSDGNIIVKKGTAGVVLILKDLDLTSTTGATVSCNKESEVKIIIEGTVKLTDAEDPADEDSSDAEKADAFDGAALKVKDGADVTLTGSGTLIIDASACKNGIKIGDENEPSFVIDGSLSIEITAANDAINGGYDVTILGGTLTINAGDDGIHADRILTIGRSDGSGPSITVTHSYEGLEGTVVNLFGGSGTVNASDDGINAANSDRTYSDTLAFSINITGGAWTVNAGGDGLDSNGNINITGGSTTIRSTSNGGDAGLDYDGSCYVADGTLTNYSGVSFDSGQGGMSQMPGQNGGQDGQMPGQNGSQDGQMPGQNGQMPGGQGGNQDGMPGGR